MTAAGYRRMSSLAGAYHRTDGSWFLGLKRPVNAAAEIMWTSVYKLYKKRKGKASPDWKINVYSIITFPGFGSNIYES